jgi:hypothetical protein
MSHITLSRPDVVTTLLARYCPPVMIFLIYLGHTEVGFCLLIAQLQYGVSEGFM